MKTSHQANQGPGDGDGVLERVNAWVSGRRASSHEKDLQRFYGDVGQWLSSIEDDMSRICDAFNASASDAIAAENIAAAMSNISLKSQEALRASPAQRARAFKSVPTAPEPLLEPNAPSQWPTQAVPASAEPVSPAEARRLEMAAWRERTRQERLASAQEASERRKSFVSEMRSDVDRTLRGDAAISESAFAPTTPTVIDEAPSEASKPEAETEIAKDVEHTSEAVLQISVPPAEEESSHDAEVSVQVPEDVSPAAVESAEDRSADEDEAATAEAHQSEEIEQVEPPPATLRFNVEAPRFQRIDQPEASQNDEAPAKELSKPACAPTAAHAPAPNIETPTPRLAIASPFKRADLPASPGEVPQALSADGRATQEPGMLSRRFKIQRV